MNDTKRLLTKIVKVRILILSLLLFIAVFTYALFFLVAHLRDDVMVEVAGEANVDFRVFYLDRVFYPNNDFFSYNPISDHLHFLMSFTDYIEVDSFLNLNLEKEAEIFYEYTAVRYLVIRYMGIKDGVSTPVVFESSTPLALVSGSVVADRLSFSPGDGSGIGGTYTVFPKDYTDFYLDFVYTQRYMMYEENVIAEMLRGFSAELLIYFTYNISIPQWNFNETLVEGYRMSLSTEIFTMALIGNSRSTLNGSAILNDPPPPITLPRIIIFVGLAALSVFGLIKGTGNLFADPNKYRQEVLTILKKYSNEIVVSNIPPDLLQYQLLQVDEFKDLLKLAVNLNRHIMCYHDDTMGEFVVVVEDKAYRYIVNYNDYPGDTQLSPINW